MTQRAFQRGLAGKAATPDGPFLQCIYYGTDVFTGSGSKIINYVAQRPMQICRFDVIASQASPDPTDWVQLAKNTIAITPTMDLQTGVTTGTLLTAATYNTSNINRVSAGDTLTITQSLVGAGSSLQVFIYYIAV